MNVCGLNYLEKIFNFIWKLSGICVILTQNKKTEPKTRSYEYDYQIFIGD